jgi:hypothetical protein
MPVTTRSNLFIPEVLADAVRGAWPDRIALLGTDAVVESSTLPDAARGGDTVKVPYFGILGDFDDVAEGAALTPATLSMSSEQASVVRSGKAFEITNWAQFAALYADPYAEATRQVLEGARRRFDAALVTAANNTSYGGTNTVDVSGGTPGTISYDAIVDALAKFGDASPDVAAVVMHSKVFFDAMKLKDNNGQPLFVAPTQGGRPSILGLPIILSDRAPVISGTPTKYVTTFVRRGALALWYNGAPSVKSDEDVLADTTIAAVHIYYVAHRYSRLPGDTKPVAVRLITQ